jgi:hypothetical protein
MARKVRQSNLSGQKHTYITHSFITPTLHSSIPRIQNPRKPLQRIHRIHSLAINPLRLLPLLQCRSSLRQSLIRKLLAQLPGSAESMDAVRELINRELEVCRDIPQPLLDNGWIR